MTLVLFLLRVSFPLWLIVALWRMVSGELLQMLLIVGVWVVIHFILMTMNARDVEWVRQGEQMRLDALRRQRQQDRWQDYGDGQ